MARAVRDHVGEENIPEPWALTLARECGHFEFLGFTESKKPVRVYRQDRWPRPGGWHEQSDFEMQAIAVAARAFILYTGKEWDLDDAEFIEWLSEGEVQG